MTYITIFVFFISYLYSLSFKNAYKLVLVFSFILVFCLGVFTSSRIFFVYFFYESSLLPILYIIVKWGSYPERSLRAMILLIYTSVFTFPFIIVIFYQIKLNISFSLFSIFIRSYSTIDTLRSLIVFLAFAVKLPIYGLHFWLPIAHVEAPTFGSMILAGILLKLGGVGLLRFSALLNLVALKHYLLSYFIVFLLISTIVCLFQSDFKRLVAYSSVSHIMAIPILLLADNILAHKRAIFLILFHGLSSPMMFILVGVIYSIFITRQLIMIRGIMLISPLLRLLMVLSFFFTLRAPPFPSFVAEVSFLVSSFYMSDIIIFIFFIFTFLSLVYNLNWLVSITFSTTTPSNIRVTLRFASFFPLIASLFFCFFIILFVFIVW